MTNSIQPRRLCVIAAAVVAVAGGIAACGKATEPKGSTPDADAHQKDLAAQPIQRSGGPVEESQARLRFEHADLAIEVLPEAKTLNGVATLTFTAKGSLTHLVLDLDDAIPPSSITINAMHRPMSAVSMRGGKLRIALPGVAHAGDRIVAKIAYGGKPHAAARPPWDDGVVWSKTADGRPWIGTTAQGFGCDLFWPCLDFPTGEPALVDLHITVPEGLQAPANGVLLGVDTLADGRTRWNWRARQPNTYAVALNIGPYEELFLDYHSRFGNTIPVFYWHLPGRQASARELFSEFSATLDFYESVVGPYPWGDEKVGVAEAPYKGMEHQTINAYGNGYARSPEGFDHLFHHEFGHEWFGNQLTVADWDDFWLHEGYDAYMQPLYGRWREGEARYAVLMDAYRNKIANLAPLISGKQRMEEEVYRTESGGPGRDIYYKGAWVLHTLRNLIGDRAFADITRLTVYGRADPAPGNFKPRYGSTREYQRIVSEVTGRDYGWFFDVYLRQAALPELLEQRADDGLALRWKTPSNLPFPLPVEIGVDGKIVRLAMRDGKGSLSVARQAHVVIDPHSRILKRSIAVERYQAWLTTHEQDSVK